MPSDIAVDGGAQAALGVQQEVPGGDDRLAVGEALRDLGALARAGAHAPLLRPEAWTSDFHPFLAVDPFSAPSLRAAGIDPAGPATVSLRREGRITCTQVKDAAAFRKAAEGSLKGYLVYTDEELVSSDYIGNPASCVFDSKCTNVVDGLLVKVSGWYDNEWGYASRCVDLLRFVGARL